MIPRKLKLAIARFPYGGNGATSHEIPEIGSWLMRLGATLARDQRIEQPPVMLVKSDTPITMTRNRAVLEAHQHDADLLLWIDSDNAPDLYSDYESGALRFFESSFDFLYKRWEKGPAIIFAPYCGPSPHPIAGGEENVYVFRWCTRKSTGPDEGRGLWLDMFSREEAAQRTGIELVAAGPTGLMLIDLRGINFTKTPAVDKINPPWFDYEWADPPFNTKKASTEDVYFTRNASLAGVPVYCNWDAWAGHAKPSMIGKPKIITSDRVAAVYREAVLRNIDGGSRTINLNSDKTAAQIAADLGLDPPQPAPNVPTTIRDDGTLMVGFMNSEEDMAALRQVVNAAVEGFEGDGEPVRIVEVGSWVGQSALEILKCSEEIELHCVDTWQGSPSDLTGEFANAYGEQRLYETFLENMGDRLNVSVFPHRLTSVEAAKRFKEQGYQFAMVYLDPDHEKAAEDIRAWLPLVRPGGIIAGHDYTPGQYQKVVFDVNEAFGREVSVKGTVWVHVVPRSEPESEEAGQTVSSHA